MGLQWKEIRKDFTEGIFELSPEGREDRSRKTERKTSLGSSLNILIPSRKSVLTFYMMSRVSVYLPSHMSHSEDLLHQLTPKACSGLTQDLSHEPLIHGN